MRFIYSVAIATTLLVALCLTVPLFSSAVHAQTRGVTRTAEDTLREQLKLGLKARREVEFEYIDTVVQRVENKTLPLELVRSIFLWARKKKPYPFQYFQRGLRIRAMQLGITAP